VCDRCEDGTTPKELLLLGVYDEIACPLMASSHRAESLAMLHTVIADELPSEGIGCDVPSLMRSTSFGALGFRAAPADPDPLRERTIMARKRLAARRTTRRREVLKNQFDLPPNRVPLALQNMHGTKRSSTAPDLGSVLESWRENSVAFSVAMAERSANAISEKASSPRLTLSHTQRTPSHFMACTLLTDGAAHCVTALTALYTV
jgi:hypothetical protein